ncbi:hypothetical protein NDU88_004667 [Pleurodeles waltl]|uniref:Uncharacterized protein n=1 Tax=Pleurodeles waltl TaxID=8319 RepID=A0AAV7TS53_PLEWA|nr:hypothetical protein NDU88_004667 [Pleurodeles waltl]
MAPCLQYVLPAGGLPKAFCPRNAQRRHVAHTPAPASPQLRTCPGASSPWKCVPGAPWILSQATPSSKGWRGARPALLGFPKGLAPAARLPAYPGPAKAAPLLPDPPAGLPPLLTWHPDVAGGEQAKTAAATPVEAWRVGCSGPKASGFNRSMRPACSSSANTLRTLSSDMAMCPGTNRAALADRYNAGTNANGCSCQNCLSI